MPNAWFLVPGVGAQGATMEDASHAFDESGTRALIALSRGITEPWGKNSRARRLAGSDHGCGDTLES